MRKLLLLFFVLMASQVTAQTPNDLKQRVIERVENHAGDLTDLSDAIWEFAEIAFLEDQSAEALSNFAEQHGFTVARGVGEIPTAFTAEYSNGDGPIIGIMGEFDALPGLSQETVPYKSPLIDAAPGHGCGHNLFGVASLGAAITIKELLESGELQGTVRFYGTPAEEKFLANYG